MTHTDGLTVRPPRIDSDEYDYYAAARKRVAVKQITPSEWVVIDYRPAGWLSVNATHPTFAAAMEHADQLVKEQNR